MGTVWILIPSYKVCIFGVSHATLAQDTNHLCSPEWLGTHYVAQAVWNLLRSICSCDFWGYMRMIPS